MRARVLVTIRTGLLLVLAACGKERRVEAPVVDVAVGALDGSVRPLVVENPQFAAPPSTAVQDGKLLGRWVGVGQQDDGQTWDLLVEITSTADGICAHADYPTVPCRGEWICEGERDGVLRAHEQLLDDSATRCIDNGKMTMRLGVDGQIDWKWTGQGQSAQAKLRRN
jgi:hypothetical protein